MKKAFVLILVFCFAISLNYFAQQQNDKKDRTEQDKKVEKIEKEEKSKKNDQVEKPVILQKEENKTVQKQFEQTDKRKKPLDFSNFITKKSDKVVDAPHNQVELKKFKKYKHKPYSQMNISQHIHYEHPIQYFYTIPPRYIYRGIWIRYYFFHDDGFFFYDGYPYYVYDNYFHRYSDTDTGSYDLVDSITDKVYATFYGVSLKQSYDRCADMRDRLNNEEGFYRYFCAERFIYDPDYNYGWNPDDYPDWYWY
ncbi:MAG: hypothetical protein Q7J16_11420 [Candidatus Cloacimonadales bacterium]|nr:hypothetical protein [Candidatus Cloacimonadales bacterium]